MVDIVVENAGNMVKIYVNEFVYFSCDNKFHITVFSALLVEHFLIVCLLFTN